MKEILRYRLRGTKLQDFQIPEGAEILSVGMDPHRYLCFWAAVDAGQPLEKRTIRTLRDSDNLADSGAFVGTVVWGTRSYHVFDG